MKHVTYLFCSLFCLSIISCTSGGSGGSNGGSGGDVPAGSTGGNSSISKTAFSGTTDSAGAVSFEFTISAGVNGVQLLATTDSTFKIRLLELTAPAGKTLVSSSFDANQSNGAGLQNGLSAFNLPYPGGNAPAAGRYSAKYSVTDRRGRTVSGGDVTLSVLTKKDSDLSRGKLKVNLCYVGPTAGSDDIRSGIESALNTWADIYDRAGISLDFAAYEFAGPAIVPNPTTGDAFYLQIAKTVRPDAINVIIASDVSGTSSNENRYGLSGGQPGSALSSNRSAIALSIIEVAGRDGKFNNKDVGSIQVLDDEERLAGEALAQLAGRYLGLEPIVGFGGSSSTARTTDHLGDTASCITARNCQDNSDARSNFMFPFPLAKLRKDTDVITSISDFYARSEVSIEQAAIMQSSVLVE